MNVLIIVHNLNELNNLLLNIIQQNYEIFLTFKQKYYFRKEKRKKNHLDFKRGATFRGIKKSARIGCISHNAKTKNK